MWCLLQREIHWSGCLRKHRGWGWGGAASDGYLLESLRSQELQEPKAWGLWGVAGLQSTLEADEVRV